MRRREGNQIADGLQALCADTRHGQQILDEMKAALGLPEIHDGLAEPLADAGERLKGLCIDRVDIQQPGGRGVVLRK